jgi:hypothetical protein
MIKFIGIKAGHRPQRIGAGRILRPCSELALDEVEEISLSTSFRIKIKAER